MFWTEPQCRFILEHCLLSILETAGQLPDVARVTEPSPTPELNAARAALVKVLHLASAHAAELGQFRAEFEDAVDCWRINTPHPMTTYSSADLEECEPGADYTRFIDRMTKALGDSRDVGRLTRALIIAGDASAQELKRRERVHAIKDSN